MARTQLDPERMGLSMLPIIIAHEGTSALTPVVKEHYRRVGLNAQFIGIYDNICENDSWVITFDKHYKHLSPNTVSFERFCFLRYLALYNFMSYHSIRACVLTDIDVLMWPVGVQYIQKLLWKDNIAFTVSKRFGIEHNHASPHCSLWTQECLLDFLEFIIDIWVNHEKHIIEDYTTSKRGPHLSGISDMYFLSKFQDARSFVYNTASSRDVFFDHNINLMKNTKDYCVAHNGIVKKVFFESKSPCVLDSKHGRHITVGSLHFQGRAKPLMKYIARECSPNRMLMNRIRAERCIGNLKAKIKR